MNQYTGRTVSRTKRLKESAISIECYERAQDGSKPDRTWQSQPFSIRTIDRMLASGTFDYNALQLYDPRCQWLDAAVDVKPFFHFCDSSGQSVRLQLPTALGKSFPIVPDIDREGMAFNSFQLISQQYIAQLRSILVTQSNDYSSGAWFQCFRSLVAECVSLVDMTLHQLYHKAEHDPLPGWTFDPARLGVRHGRNLSDKLKWIGQITAAPLHASVEMRAFTRLKDLRNHLQHFDPPCFCCTVEEVAGWLNDAT